MFRSIGVVLFAALAGCAAGVRDETSADAARVTLERAIDAAGGRRALAQNPVLAWRGEATVHVAGKHIGIAAETTVRADGHSSSTSWRLDQDRSQARIMTITPDAGTVAKVGADPEPLPDEIARHEREQYSLYQVARLLPLESATLAGLPRNAAGEVGIAVSGASVPSCELRFDEDYRLVEIRHRIDAPGRKSPVEQVLRFGGTLESRGVRWFRTLNITWDGLPYFDLLLKSFEARAHA